MTILSRNQATVILRNLGWRIRSGSEYTAVVKRFQAAWNLGAALKVDGLVGPATSAALLKSEARRRAGQSTASAHFSFLEVRCRCGGKYSDCKRIWTTRSTFQMMEKYRSKSGRPMPVVSGCRCPRMNKSVGGSPTSRHLQGLACDVQARYTVSTVKSWRIATHIGYGRLSRRVKHIDIGSGRTTSNPAVYVDGN